MGDARDGALPTGAMIAGHRIERVLGKGGFSKTYLVREQRAGTVWVLKEYFPERIASRDRNSLEVIPKPGSERAFQATYEAFFYEADLLRQLPRHPHIVSVRGLFKKFGTVYMLLEFVDGVPFKRYLENRDQITQETLLRALDQICSGLEHLHSKRLLHRDIKPENIIVRSSGEPVLIDFGAARAFEVEPGTTSVFTPVYAPVEQQGALSNLNLPEGPWTDLFALGVVCYEFAAGRRPPSARDRYQEVQNGRPDPYTTCGVFAGAGYSAAFASGVDWALELMPENRPGTVGDWLGALRGQGRPEVSVHDVWHDMKAQDARAPAAFLAQLGQGTPDVPEPVRSRGTDFAVSIFQEQEEQSDNSIISKISEGTGMPAWNLIVVGVMGAILTVVAIVAALL